MAKEFLTPSVCGVVSPEVKKAIYKMGPYYDYMMVEDRLYVNTGNGKWLRLRYRKEEKLW